MGVVLVKIVGGVLVKSPKTVTLLLGVCVIIAVVVAEAMIIMDNPAENSVFRGICPLH